MVASNTPNQTDDYDL